LEDTLKSDKKIWKIIANDLIDIIKKYGNDRRTKIGSEDKIIEFDPSAYVIKENTNIILSNDGWIKRLGKIQSIDKIRTREGDFVSFIVPGNTANNTILLSNDGIAYTIKSEIVPPSS